MLRAALAITLLLLATPAHAEWRAQDTQRQAAYLTLHAIDWRQTRTIADEDYCDEVNPALGNCPDRSSVDQYFIATAMLHTMVSYALPPRYRASFQYLTIGVQAGAVSHNARVGVRIDW